MNKSSSHAVTSLQVTEQDFRATMATFCTGVVVVTASPHGNPVGLTCQSFTSLSTDPPLVSFNTRLGSRTWPSIRAAGAFAVNILAADQESLSRTFSGKAPDRYAGVAWRYGSHGLPLLDGALAHVQCTLEAVHPGGDHHIVVGRVLAVERRSDEADPLLYYRSRYRALAGPSGPPADPAAGRFPPDPSYWSGDQLWF